MVSPDSECRPKVSEIEQKPQWITLHRDIFPSGSVGYTLFPEILEGRKRPETFDESLEWLFWIEDQEEDKENPTLIELHNRGLRTARDVLKLPYDELSSFTHAEDVQGKLAEYLQDLAVLPHAKVLQAAFGYARYPIIIPPGREQELIDAVENVLPRIEPREQRVLRLLMGLDDGITRSLAETAKEIDNNLTRERVRLQEASALRKLRHPSRSRMLREYFPTAEDSLARRIYSAVFIKEIPRFREFRFNDLNFSDSVLGELFSHRRIQVLLSSEEILEFMRMDLKHEGFTLSQEAVDEIGRAIGRYIIYEADQEEAEMETASITPQRTEEPVQLANHLLPEIPLTVDQLAALSEISIADLNLSVRSYNALLRVGIKSAADILSLSKKELLDIRGFGIESARNLGQEIQQVLELPEENYPKGYISQILASTFETLWHRDQVGLQKIQLLVNSAIKQGAKSPAEIQEWIWQERRIPKLLGINTESWVFRAVIEYILNHPEET